MALGPTVAFPTLVDVQIAIDTTDVKTGDVVYVSDWGGFVLVIDNRPQPIAFVTPELFGAHVALYPPTVPTPGIVPGGVTQIAIPGCGTGSLAVIQPIASGSNEYTIVSIASEANSGSADLDPSEQIVSTRIE